MKIINDGHIGRIDYLRGNFRFSMKNHNNTHGLWVFDRTQGGGLILESSVHMWDMVRHVSGSEVVFEIKNGIKLNLVGGHTPGSQTVTVQTEKGHGIHNPIC